MSEKRPTDPRIKKKLDAKVGPVVCRELMAYAERTGCPIEDVAAVILAGPPRRQPVDKEREWTPEDIRTFCEQVTDAHNRGLRLHGESFKNPSDYKPSLKEMNEVADIRISRGRTVKPLGPKQLFYVFRYRIPPAEEIHTTVWFTRYWQSATHAFRKVTKGEPVELCHLERFPFPRNPYWESSGADDLWGKKSASFIPAERFRKMREQLGGFIKDEAHKIAYRLKDTQCASDLEQEAWIRLGAVDSNDIEQLKLEAYKAMDAARHRKGFMPPKGANRLDDRLI